MPYLKLIRENFFPLRNLGNSNKNIYLTIILPCFVWVVRSTLLGSEEVVEFSELVQLSTKKRQNLSDELVIVTFVFFKIYQRHMLYL